MCARCERKRMRLVDVSLCLPRQSTRTRARARREHSTVACEEIAYGHAYEEYRE